VCHTCVDQVVESHGWAGALDFAGCKEVLRDCLFDDGEEEVGGAVRVMRGWAMDPFGGGGWRCACRERGGDGSFWRRWVALCMP
jgi:hypothetical protein